MALISIIISLVLDRLLRDYHDLRDLSWFEQYTRNITGRVKIDHGVVKFLAVLVLPVLSVVVLLLIFSSIPFGILSFVFSIAILIYCLGPACLSSEVEAYIDARSLGDDDEALHYAGSITGDSASTSLDQQTTDVTRAILHVANERIFSVVFWFVLLGPLGAVLYRLSTNISQQHDDENRKMIEFAKFFQSVMAWAPARLLAAGYALTGDFDGAWQAYRSSPHDDNIAQSNYDALVATGLGALRDSPKTDEISSIQAARGLVTRSIVVLIAMFAVLTLGGWLG